MCVLVQHGAYLILCHKCCCLKDLEHIGGVCKEGCCKVCVSVGKVYEVDEHRVVALCVGVGEDALEILLGSVHSKRMCMAFVCVWVLMHAILVCVDGAET